MMKRIAVLFLAIAAPVFLAAGPARARSADGTKFDEPVVVDLGRGTTAAVFIADRGKAPACWNEAIAETATRLRAISVDFPAAARDEGKANYLATGLRKYLAERGIERACLVACNSCCPAAVSAASLEARGGEVKIAGLVLIGAPGEFRRLAVPAVYYPQPGPAPDSAYRRTVVEKIVEIASIGERPSRSMSPRGGRGLMRPN